MGRWTFRILLSLGLLLASSCVCAQPEPRPEWSVDVPQAPTGVNYRYVVGIGLGGNELEANLAAEEDALRRALMAGGLVSLTEQSLSLRELERPRDVRTTISAMRLAWNVRCMSPPLYRGQASDHERYKVYVLLQMQQDANHPPDFTQTFELKCESRKYRRKYEAWVKKSQNPTTRKRKRRDDSWKTEATPFRNFRYLNLTYLGLGIVNFHWTIAQRFGGTILGVGYEASIGVPLTWSVGFRLYPYRHLFLLAQYGMLTPNFLRPKEAHREFSPIRGPSFMAGVDVDFLNFMRRDDGLISTGLTVLGGISLYPDGRITPNVMLRLNCIFNFFDPERFF